MSSALSSAHRHHVIRDTRLTIQSEQRFEARDTEHFDRTQFALRVLDLLRPKMSVTVYEVRRSLQITRGRDWAIGPDATWALVGIPRDASRHHITFALAEMVGISEASFIASLIARAISPARES